MEKSLEKFKHIERISRQTRHHQTFLNQIYDQKLHRELDHLTDEYEQSFIRSKTQQKLERQRKQVLDITIQQIAHERRIPTNIEQTLPKNNVNRPASSSIKLPTPGTPCRLFSRKCQLYPCQPIHHYTSFIKKEHDQTLRHRNSSPKKPDPPTRSSHIQDLYKKMQEKNNRSQFAITLRNQYHLANRHVYMERTKERLDEQSRLLHDRLTDKKNFNYAKEHRRELKHAIYRHLESSAKFCA